MKLYIIVPMIVGIVIHIIFANFMRKVAVLKGYGDDAHAWALCFWLGMMGGIYVIALPDLVSQNQNQQIIKMLQESRKWHDKV